MFALLVVSLIWAASFGLIKHNLAGVDPHAIAWVRLVIALPVFVPVFRRRGLTPLLLAKLATIGAVQYGVMYILYIQAYQYLAAHEVALWTITTPVYVVICHDILHRRGTPRAWLLAALAMGGAALLSTDHLPQAGTQHGWQWGVCLIQLANLCFAAGQVAYRHLRQQQPHIVDREVFAVLLLGGVLVTGVTTLWTGGYGQLGGLNVHQWSTLVYLGTVATGFGFFAWNWGATRVRATTLSVLNNAKIPVAVAIALFVFGERIDPLRFSVGAGLVLVALVLARRGPLDSAAA